MNGQEKFNRVIAKCPHSHTPWCWDRPHWSRRRFFQLLGAGVSGYFLEWPARAGQTVWQAPVTPQNTAKNCIFVLLSGAASPIDTFNFIEVPGVTPSNFSPETMAGIGKFPTGLFPKLKDKLSDIAVVRSMRAWAAVHNLARTWVQIGRNPVAALGDIAPALGSVVAMEKEPERQPTQAFPTFLALNSNDASGGGYFGAKYSPFKIEQPASTGLRNASSTAMGGPAVLNERFSLLHLLDDSLRVRSPLGKGIEDMDAFYTAARGMIDHPAVASAFRFSTEDSQRYGESSFGNSCLVAKQVLAANQGTRYIHLTLGGWDHHQDIYDANDPASLYGLSAQLDNGLSALLGDLKSSGLLNETLVVVQGEFGRTVGPLTGDGGRDHHLQQFVLFAGAGVKGGRAIGATDATGAFTENPGWSRNRDVHPEDVEATIESALGINWTTIRYDDPFGRGFEYVPYAKEDIYGPLNELWS